MVAARTVMRPPNTIAKNENIISMSVEAEMSP